MKNHIDSNFATAVLALVAACVGFAFWFHAAQDQITIDTLQTVKAPSSSSSTTSLNSGVDEATLVENNANSLESSHGVRYSAPGQMSSLCDRLGEVQLRDADGEFHRFRTPAGFMTGYNNDELWIAGESGTDAAIFYFDKSGLVIDICQPLFAPETCKKYEEFLPYDALDICGE